jgi:diguanylate cyclase (GGDEF)-like protein
MSIPNLSPHAMHAAVAELEQALFNHEQWHEALQSTLICRLPPDQRDIEKDAHRNCRFGQWYYSTGALKLQGHPGFEEIEIEHKRMHQFAATLLRAAMSRVPISLQDYERFTSAMKRMRLEITNIKHELEDALYNLDPLTGAISRVGMLTKLREQHELVRRDVHPCCIVMMDIDRFKAINDTYGHMAGDRVLAALARYVMTHLRPYDKFFRYGGEEFLICAPDTDTRTGYDLVERLRKELATIPIDTENGETVHITVCFGLTQIDPGVSVEQAIDRADKALYRAKQTGRNRTVIWDASMT